MSPSAFRRAKRLEKAATLVLTASSWTNENIAAACGYADVRQFLREFREAYGYGPSGYSARRCLAKSQHT